MPQEKRTEGSFRHIYLVRMTKEVHNVGMNETQDLTGELLKSVSRSFYLTIYWLPTAMRPGVALGYMLARATDSVADTSTASPACRDRVLREMDRAIAGEADSLQIRHLTQELAHEMASAQHSSAEQALLTRFGDCLEALKSFPEDQRRAIRKVLRTIIEGQLWDISYFLEKTEVEDDAATELYTYKVAGCVGEFWTELGSITMGADFCSEDKRELMIQAAIRYGKGLQIINILRDVDEDAARGRSYLHAGASVQKWLNRADYFMNDGLDYCKRLRHWRLRFASALPALIGKKTLALLRKARPGEGKVKIPRRSVYCCMLHALWLSLAGRGA